MSIEQMKEKFKGEWVVILEPEYTPSHEIEAGTVVFHSHHKQIAHQELMKWRGRSMGIYYIGEVVPDLPTVLGGHIL